MLICHWYFRFFPVAAILNVTVCPAFTLCDVGCPVIFNCSTIFSFAVSDTALFPLTSVTTHLCSLPLCESSAVNVYAFVFPDSIPEFVQFFPSVLICHWYFRFFPVAAILNVTVCPAFTLCDVGCPVIFNCSTIFSFAVSDTALFPLTSVTTHLCSLPLCESSAVNVYAFVFPDSIPEFVQFFPSVLICHWYFRFFPVAAILNVTVCPAFTLCDVGCPVIIKSLVANTDAFIELSINTIPNSTQNFFNIFIQTFLPYVYLEIFQYLNS